MINTILAPGANPATFGNHITGLQPAAHHWPWLRAAVNPRIDRLLIIAPRESAKTTWMLLLIAWRIGSDPLRTHFIGSVTGDQADKRLNAIKTWIESSPAWKTAFPHIVPDFRRGWSTNGLYVRDDRYSYEDWIHLVATKGQLNTPTLTAGGVGSSSVVGSRFTGIVLIDDPHDEKNSHTATQRDGVNNWLMQVVSNAITAEGQMIVITTRWNRDDIAARLRINPRFHTIEVKAVQDDGRSYWPALWPIARLDQKRIEIGTAMFRAAYQNDPLGLVGKVFQSEWLLPLPTPLPPMVRVGIFADLAISEKQTADFTAIGTFGLDAENNFYILNMVRGQWSFNKQQLRLEAEADYALKMYGMLEVVGIEAVQYQAAAVQEMKRTTLHPVLPVSPDNDKVTRARPWAARAESGSVFCNRDALWFGAFLDEAVDFPNGKNDDQIDTVSAGWAYFARPATFTEVW